MSKKLLIILSILFIAIIFTIPCSYANNTMNDVKQGAGTLVNDVRNGIGYAEGAVEGAIKDVGNTVSGATGSITRDTNNFLRNDNYTATRTATSANALTTNNMFWTWIILAVAAVIIVSLVWYYGNQRDNRID